MSWPKENVIRRDMEAYAAADCQTCILTKTETDRYRYRNAVKNTGIHNYILKA